VDGYVEAAQRDQAHQAAQSLAPSSTSTFTAAGFSPGEQVTAILHSMPVALGTYRADARGVVIARVHIPTGFAPGRHTIILTGKTSRRSQAFPVTIRPSGTDHLRWYVVALAASLLAAVAAGAVYRARGADSQVREDVN
jgi:primary-amine oxidase